MYRYRYKIHVEDDLFHALPTLCILYVMEPWSKYTYTECALFIHKTKFIKFHIKNCRKKIMFFFNTGFGYTVYVVNTMKCTPIHQLE